MTTRDVARPTAASATLAELRSPGTVVAATAVLAWLVFWEWRVWDDDATASAPTTTALGVVVVGTMVHRGVRQRRGLTGTHPAAPLAVGLGVVAVLAAVAGVTGQALDPTGAAVYAAGMAAITAVFGTLERRSLARRAGSATG